MERLVKMPEWLRVALGLGSGEGEIAVRDGVELEGEGKVEQEVVEDVCAVWYESERDDVRALVRFEGQDGLEIVDGRDMKVMKR